MEHVSTLFRENGIAGPLAPALSPCLDTRDRPGAVAHRRAWASLEAAHEAHHDALATLADAPVRAEAVPELADRLRSAARVRRARACGGAPAPLAPDPPAACRAAPSRAP